MTTLITGASGFLGGRLTEVLAQRGEDVRVLARDTSDLSHLAGLPIRITRGELGRPDTLTEATRGVKTVYHCAGLSADWGRWADFEGVNVTGVKNLLDAAGRAGTVERFLHVSTTDVYGYPEEACPESHGIRDIGLPYNRSKGLGEKAAWDFHRATGLPVTVVRPCNIFGPRSKDFVVEVSNLLLQGQMMTIDGGARRAGLLFVDNAVEGIIAAARSPAAVGQSYNLRDESDVTWRQYLDRLAAGLGARRAWINLRAGLALAIARAFEGAYGLLRRQSRPLLTRHSVYLLGRDQGFPIDKARQELGFRSVVGFDEALQRTLSWLESPAGQRAVPRKRAAREVAHA
ncbi:MAG TPA: NAD-dependent epimerase/dehydratase family protein [Kofleriaceae bacterium]|nr:NAD-dependent epimerase/dehydratase family protein [Kofleriaceae bacterium]